MHMTDDTRVELTPEQEWAEASRARTSEPVAWLAALLLSGATFDLTYSAFSDCWVFPGSCTVFSTFAALAAFLQVAVPTLVAGLVYRGLRPGPSRAVHEPRGF